MEESIKTFLKRLKENESTVSTVLGGLVVVVIGVLLFNYFQADVPQGPSINGGETSEEVAEGEVTFETDESGELVPRGLPTTHTVEAGEHLWSVSERYYGNGYNWVDIAEANELDNPSYIESGQELTIPRAALRLPEATETVAGTLDEAESSLLAASTYTVQKGDHLWGIAVRAYGDGYRWVDIYQANQEMIADPDIIEPEMRLSLPR